MANPDNEEEDYMSDAFLAKLDDKRPGLATGNKVREYKKEAKRKVNDMKYKTKPKVVIEKEHRDEGLQKSISADNKGFALLAKMGYKPGMSLGKKGTGRKDPVPIEIKTGRGGLGIEAEKKRKQIEMDSMRLAMAAKRKKTDMFNQQNYRVSFQEKQKEREIERDLNKSQAACQQLDLTQSIESPEEPYYWPAALPKHDRLIESESGYLNELDESESESDSNSDDGDEDKPDIKTEEMLISLTRHLRTKYQYCIWCGIKFTDEKDLDDNCPGETAEHHR